MIKRHKKILLILGLTAFLSGCGSGNTTGPIQSETNFLMDTVAKIDIYDKKDQKIMDQAFARTNEIEKLMSKTIKTSDISRINAAAGLEAVDVSPETYELIKRSIDFAEKTNGAFDPSIGPLMDLWDIKDVEGRDWIPEAEEINQVRQLIDYKNIELDQGRVKLLKKGMKLDLGGIAKGYGADQVRQVLKENQVESSIIDLGGNIFAMGSKPGDLPWNIGIKQPDSTSNDYIGVLSVKDKTVVTSGAYERFFKLDNKIYHHILDPHTGYPAQSEFESVTVVGPSSRDADALATSIYILGLDQAKRLYHEVEGIDLILLDKKQNLYITKTIEEDFSLKDQALNLKIID